MIAAEAPGWRGATKAHPRWYVTEEQRSQAGSIDRESDRLSHRWPWLLGCGNPERAVRERPRAGAAKACYARAMCIICIDFERGALRPKEARRALREMRDGMDATSRERDRKEAGRSGASVFSQSRWLGPAIAERSDWAISAFQSAPRSTSFCLAFRSPAALCAQVASAERNRAISGFKSAPRRASF